MCWEVVAGGGAILQEERTTSALVLCSRSARPQKDLARQPQKDHHGCHFPGLVPTLWKKTYQASLDGAVALVPSGAKGFFKPGLGGRGKLRVFLGVGLRSRTPRGLP